MLRRSDWKWLTWFKRGASGKSPSASRPFVASFARNRTLRGPREHRNARFDQDECSDARAIVYWLGYRWRARRVVVVPTSTPDALREI